MKPVRYASWFLSNVCFALQDSWRSYLSMEPKKKKKNEAAYLTFPCSLATDSKHSLRFAYIVSKRKIKRNYFPACHRGRSKDDSMCLRHHLSHLPLQMANTFNFSVCHIAENSRKVNVVNELLIFTMSGLGKSLFHKAKSNTWIKKFSTCHFRNKVFLSKTIRTYQAKDYTNHWHPPLRKVPEELDFLKRALVQLLCAARGKKLTEDLSKLCCPDTCWCRQTRSEDTVLPVRRKLLDVKARCPEGRDRTGLWGTSRETETECNLFPPMWRRLN